MNIPVDKLRSFLEKATIALPLAQKYAEVVVDTLLAANLWRMDSHEVSRYPIFRDRLKKKLVC